VALFRKGALRYWKSRSLADEHQHPTGCLTDQKSAKLHTCLSKC